CYDGVMTVNVNELFDKFLVASSGVVLPDVDADFNDTGLVPSADYVRVLFNGASVEDKLRGFVGFRVVVKLRSGRALSGVLSACGDGYSIRLGALDVPVEVASV